MIRDRAPSSGSGVVCDTNDSAKSPIAFELLRAQIGAEPHSAKDSQRPAKGDENQGGVAALLQGPALSVAHRARAALRASVLRSLILHRGSLHQRSNSAKDIIRVLANAAKRFRSTLRGVPKSASFAVTKTSRLASEGAALTVPYRVLL